MLAMQGQGYRKYGLPPYREVPTPVVHGTVPGSNPTRPGWNTSSRPAICYGCYEDGHILPESKMPISNFPKVADNYEKLSADNKSRVPKTHYEIAKRFVEAKTDAAKDKTPDPKTAENNESKS